MWGNSILIGGIEQRPGDMVICHKLLVVQFGQYWIWDIGQSKSKGEVKEGPVKKPQVSCWRFWITACRSEMIDWQFWSDLYCNHLLNLNFSRKHTVNLLPSPGSPLLPFVWNKATSHIPVPERLQLLPCWWSLLSSAFSFLWQ